ncbi:MAG: ATP-dependent RecD-like DNA helicase, partial [Waddliaceae bacterium]|nr:ATP-dependent RecD-like DNA helicase [Waddliaceae bacterium]
MEQLYGYIEKIVYSNYENGFTVARLKEPRKYDLTCIVGTMPGIQPGETVSCSGNWKVDPVHGGQFQVKEYHTAAPSTVVGIEKYLASGLIRGIGPVYAKKIVKAFGADALDIIEDSPERLLGVPGIGPKRVDTIREHWNEQKAVRDVMVFLQSYGVSPIYAQKIYRKYGEDCIEKVNTNPYLLARDIRGIGFQTADTIAKNMDIPHDSAHRIEAGIEHVLSELSSNGHVCYPVDDFVVRAAEILGVDEQAIRFQIGLLEKEQRIVTGHMPYGGDNIAFIWLKGLHVAESGVSNHVTRIRYAPTMLRNIDITKAVEWVEGELSFDLASHQKDAVAQAMTSKVQIITGGPGTGKSTITKAILMIYQKLTDDILLAAPTGRAAKRLEEITGAKASTIHSLLEYDFSIMGFKKNHSNPLNCDLLIVDEASMIDTTLMYHLLKSVPDRARVIFVGDINQLPSIGPGNVLKDMILSMKIPTTTLTEIFRQAAGSHIVTNAHRINMGVLPELNTSHDSDFFFIEKFRPEDVLSTIVGLITKRLPKRYGLSPLNDIQVLTPMKRGIIGTENLNIALQKIMNPRGHGISRGGKDFLVGDKIMQIRNNYNKEVFNGDIGQIKDVDTAEQHVIVEFDGKDIEYTFAELD